MPTRGPHDYDGMICKNCGEQYMALGPTWCEKYPGASPQTGGGDAAERAGELASAVLYRVTEHLAKTGEWAEEDIEALRAGLAMLDSREADLRSSRREGAETMREDAMDAILSDPGALESVKRWFASRIGALPIPGSKAE